MRISKITDRWFEIPNDPDSGRIKIHHITPGELTDISDQAYKQDVIYKPVAGQKGKVEPIITQDVDSALNRKLLLTTAIVDWENFFDREDKPMECTPDNIMRCSREIDGFYALVEEFRTQLAEDIAQEKEDQRKNSQSSVSQPVKPIVSNAEQPTECTKQSQIAEYVSPS
jgi:hypothetical protein